MPHDMPRGFQFIRAAIADVEDLGELAKLREFAREQWRGDSLYPELEALLDQREAEIACRPGTQIRLPLDDHHGDSDDDLDRDAG